MSPAGVWRIGIASDPGLERSTNEDRIYVDETSGIFLVVDGVGGQAAGEKAAETAVQIIARELRAAGDSNDPPERCVRRAIVAANNEIFRLAGMNPEWYGMACVLTLAVAHDDIVTVGHVGDSRLYLAWDGHIRKVTSDHSPVGEREDRGQLTEEQAMRHPSRNEVFRDVGSRLREADDEDFIEIRSFPFRHNAALLLCSDGLSDALLSSEINTVIEEYDGDPESVASRLISAANEAGGRDNISVVFVAGGEFKGAAGTSLREARARHAITRVQGRRWRKVMGPVLWLLAGVLGGIFAGHVFSGMAAVMPPQAVGLTSTVSASDPKGIIRALSIARPGATIEVAAGDFFGPVVLGEGVHLVSVTPGAAVIRADPAAGGVNAGIAVIARGIKGGRLSGFRIIGDERAPLATGVLIENAGVEIDEVEISGAADCAIRIAGHGAAVLRANRIQSNPGCGVSVGEGSSPRLVGNRISENGLSSGAPRPGLEIHPAASPTVENNIITGNGQSNPELSARNVTGRGR